MKITNNEKFELLLNDLQAILVEGRYLIQTEIIKTKWLVGQAVEETFGHLERKDTYGLKLNEMISNELKLKRIIISTDEIKICRQYYRENKAKDWELVATNLPKNASWTKERLKLQSRNPAECYHNFEETNYWRCKDCGKKLFSLPEVDNSVK